MLFDTRYFWAVFTEKDPALQRKLRAILDSAPDTFASSVSIYEVYKLTLAHEGKTVADLRAATIMKEFTMVDVSSEIAKDGARMSLELKVPMADALIMATARQLRVPCVTDDPHFSSVKKVWT